MPGDQPIGARRHAGESELARRVGNRVIGVVDREGPALHERMEPALHDERPAAFAEVDGPQHGLAGLVVVDSMQVTPLVLEVHRQR